MPEQESVCVYVCVCVCVCVCVRACARHLFFLFPLLCVSLVGWHQGCCRAAVQAWLVVVQLCAALCAAPAHGMLRAVYVCMYVIM
jgi:hypothetical protein